MMGTEPTRAFDATQGPSAGEEGGVPGSGSTWIADTIVSKLAALAATEVDGVRGLRPDSGSRGWGRRPRTTDKAAVTVVDGVATVELRLVVDHDARIPELIDAVRAGVVGRVERSTGMRVGAVNIGVVDIASPADDTVDPDGETTESGRG